MSSKCGIRMDGTGKPTEVQISQCWVFNTEFGILVTVHPTCAQHLYVHDLLAGTFLIIQSVLVLVSIIHSACMCAEFTCS